MEKITVDVNLVDKEQDNAELDCKDEIRVKAMSDVELRKQLCIYGISPGPVLSSTRAIYENKLLQLMKQCPKIVASVNSELDSSENDEGKGNTTEVVLETNNLKVTAECASGLDHKPPIDVTERQKKLLSPDVEHSLAKIVAELQEILPEGKMSLHRSQGLRRKSGSSPERNYKRKKSDAPPHQDCGYPDTNSVGQSTRRRTVRETPSTVKQGTKAKSRVIPEKPRAELIPTRVKIAALAIFIFLLFVYITMETNLGNPFSDFIKGK